MGRFGLALRVLFNGQFAGEVARLTAGTIPALESRPQPQSQPASDPVRAPEPRRSEAISLLEALQREARLIDFIKEPIDQYTDAQIGAAVRNVHRDCGVVFERMFAIRPLLDGVEGSQVELGEADPGRIRLTGNVSGPGPSKGKLAHHGWHALRCELPAWTGSESGASVIAAAEVEV